MEYLIKLGRRICEFGLFRLAHDTIAHYYSLQDITFRRDNENLYITLRIPLMTTRTVFIVYKIQSVPIMLGENRQETSIMSFDKPYIAISQDQMFYIMLTNSEYNWCQGKMRKKVYTRVSNEGSREC